jgi:queuine tRNA-ribosyltransferase
MRRIREAIIADQYPAFLRNYFSTLYAADKTKYPTWVVDALRGVNVDLLQD